MAEEVPTADINAFCDHVIAYATDHAAKAEPGSEEALFAISMGASVATIQESLQNAVALGFLLNELVDALAPKLALNPSLQAKVEGQVVKAQRILDGFGFDGMAVVETRVRA